MKIVHCLFTLRTGGAQTLTVDMLNILCAHHDVALIVVNDESDEGLLRQLDQRVAVYRLNRREGSRNPLPVLHLNVLLARLRPTIIHCHERRMIRLIGYRRARTVYTIHDVQIPTDTFGQYDALVAISDAVAADVHRRAGLPVERVDNGISVHRFVRRDCYELSDSEPVRLVQISRLVHEKKGQDVLIDALAVLVHQRNLTNLRLDFIGDGVSKPYLTDLARARNVAQYVTFVGEKSRDWICQNLASYHVLVQPSRYEGFGLTVLEGCAAGLPVVASAIEGPAEILRKIAPDALFASENSEACAAVLATLVDAYRRGQVAATARQSCERVWQQFSIESTVSAYEIIYQRLTATQCRTPRLAAFGPYNTQPQ